MRCFLRLSSCLKSVATFLVHATSIAGKAGARVGLRDSLRSGIQAEMQELFEPVFRTPTGSFVFGTDDRGRPHMPRASLSVLSQQFVRGNRSTASEASLQLTRRTIYEELVTIPEMLDRIDARIAEVKEEQSELLEIDVPAEQPPLSNTRFPENIKVKRGWPARSSGQRKTQNALPGWDVLVVPELGCPGLARGPTLHLPFLAHVPMCSLWFEPSSPPCNYVVTEHVSTLCVPVLLASCNTVMVELRFAGWQVDPAWRSCTCMHERASPASLCW